MHHPTDRITYTTAFVTPVVEHWLEREITQWVHSAVVFSYSCSYIKMDNNDMRDNIMDASEITSVEGNLSNK